MACSIEEHKKKVNDEMHKIFHQTETIKIVDNIVTITPSEKSKDIDTIERAYKAAKRMVDEANNWGKKKYGGAFSNGYAIINKSKSDGDKITINLHFPRILEESLQYNIDHENDLLNYNSKLRIIPASEDVFYNPVFNEVDKNKNNNKVDILIKDKFFNNSNTSKSLDVLSKIANSSHVLNKLASKLMLYAKHNNVEIILEDVEEFKNTESLKLSKDPNFSSNAYYNPNTNKIHIAKNAKFPIEGVEAIILHEIIHSVTFHFLRNNSQVSKDFQKLYEFALKQKSVNDNHYGWTNLDEFMTAIFTSPNFIRTLSGMKASDGTKYKNLFEDIINYILSLMKISKANSLYEEAVAVASNIMNDYQESWQAVVDSNIEYESTANKQEKEPVKPTFEKQYVFFKRKINELERDLNRISQGTDEYTIKEAELKKFIRRFEEATEDNDKAEYIKMANEYLDWVETLISSLPENPDKYTIEHLSDAFEILNTFSDFTGLKDRPNELREKLFPYISKHNLKTINNFNTSGTEYTQDDINKQNKDVRWSASKFGSLLDSVNYIVSTIGYVIKNAQNRASTKNKQLEHVIQKEVDELSEYAKNNGTTLEKIYDLFISENNNGGTSLAQMYNIDGTLNSNYAKIQSTPELKKFYDFYQRVIIASQSQLPYKVGKFYILNKTKSEGIKEDLKKILPVENFLFDSFVNNKSLLADIIPDMYRQHIPIDKKSNDLGSGLLEFAAYANNHYELSNALPETRLLQEQLKYEQQPSGHIVERQFISSSNSKEKVYGKDSNAFKQVSTVIDMQLKGEMKVEHHKPIELKFWKVKDKDGKVVGYKQVRIESVLDKGLQWNSLLRIGLSPITAITNILFGDISNIMEAIGGKYFNISNLKSSTNIFFKQINYNSSSNKESNIYKWLEKLNPLQELDDYELGETLKATPKKMSSEKILEIMYIGQKKGELYLQTRTMIAMLIHDGFMNPDGTNTKKGEEALLNELKQTELTNKIQKVNQIIHGRYSQREAATMQQSVYYRMVIQFRKWIPSAIESRFGDYKPWDSRIQSDSEGRYRTYNKVIKAKSVGEAFENLFLPLLNSKAALERGNMTPTEIYNMRKNMVELILITSIALLFAGFNSGDDEERLKRKKNPYYKAGMTMLNRIAGDLSFFYNPKNISNMASNAVPMSKLMIDLMKVTATLPHAMYLGDYKIKRGSLKGNNDFWSRNIETIIPGLAPFTQIQRIVNKEDVLPELN